MKKTNQKGFTLIEVILVLAIGGLIFLLAFLAFQQVQRNRRDTQRRSDVARAAAAFNDLKADNPGASPSATDWQTYVGTSSTTGIKLITPEGGDYTVYTAATKPSTLAKNNLTLVVPTSGDPEACIGLESGGAPSCRGTNSSS